MQNLKRYVTGESKEIKAERTSRHNRSISRTPVATKMEIFVTLINGGKLLINTRKSSILVVKWVLYTPHQKVIEIIETNIYVIYQVLLWKTRQNKCLVESFLLLFIPWFTRFFSLCLIWVFIGDFLFSFEIGVTWMLVSCICSWIITYTINWACHWPDPTIVPWICNTVDISLQSHSLNHRYFSTNEYKWRNKCSMKHAV